MRCVHTLGKAFSISKNIENRFAPLAWASYICESRSARAIWADRPLRQPYWVLLRILWESRNQDSLVLMIFSKTLLRVLSSEMGRYDKGSEGSLQGFKIGMIKAIFQLLGKEVENKILFRSEVRCAMAFLCSFCSMTEQIWSRPGADLFEQRKMVWVTSCSEIGLL